MMKVTIIGGGKVGSTIAKKLETIDSVSYQVVYNSDATKEKLLEQEITESSIVDWESADFNCDIVLICVKDYQIEQVAKQLSESITNGSPLVVHTSGTKRKEILEVFIDKGFTIAAAHPYQTFAESESDILDGIPWGLDVGGDSADKLEQFISLISGKPVKLSDETLDTKSLYHISAVAASNFMALSVELAKNIAEESNISWEQFLPHIMRTTLDNNLNEDSDEPAITGPVVRGDVETVKNHVSALGESVNGVIYKNMSESLALMALDKGLISGEKFEELMEVLA